MPSGLRKPDPRINAGDLDQRVGLLAPLYNDAGDEIVSWTLIDTVWASVDANLTLEQTEGQRTVANTDFVIQIRYRDDIDARFRLTHRNNTYEVLGQMNIISRRERLELICRLVM
jgi:SPP1 family predicted phage head-tail adaptor